MPDGVRQGEDIAAVHLAVALVAGREVQQGEGVARPLRLRGQSRGADHGHDAVVENDPVRLLRERSRESVSARPQELNDRGWTWSFPLQEVQLSPGRWRSSTL